MPNTRPAHNLAECRRTRGRDWPAPRLRYRTACCRALFFGNRGSETTISTPQAPGYRSDTSVSCAAEQFLGQRREVGERVTKGCLKIYHYELPLLAQLTLKIVCAKVNGSRSRQPKNIERRRSECCARINRRTTRLEAEIQICRINKY